MKNTIVIITGILILSQAPKIGAVTMSYDEGTPCSYSLKNKHAERYLNSLARNFGQSRVSGPTGSPSSARAVAGGPCSLGCPKPTHSSPGGERQTTRTESNAKNKGKPENLQKPEKLSPLMKELDKQIKVYQIRRAAKEGALIGFLMAASIAFPLSLAVKPLVVLGILVGASLVGAAIGYIVGKLTSKGINSCCAGPGYW